MRLSLKSFSCLHTHKNKRNSKVYEKPQLHYYSYYCDIRNQSSRGNTHME